MASIIILYYVAPSGSSLTPKRMTLNDLEWSFLLVNIWSKFGIQWTGVLAFGENCSDICRATHILSAAKKCSPACTGDIRVMELFSGITEQEASKQ